MNLIGISGKKQSGKDTVAGIIANYLHPAKTIRVGFADALKNELCTMFNITRRYLDEHKESFRLIMQGYGTDFRRNLTQQDYWILKLEKTLTELPSDVQYVVVPDVRFLNEAEYIKKLGGKMLLVERHYNDGIWLPDTHISENELADYKNWDHILYNSGTLNNLALTTQAIVHEL